MNRTRIRLQASRKPRIALYSHDALGMGHMRRNSLIAQALAGSGQGGVVLLISGAKELKSLTLAPGIDCVTLPAMTKDAAGRYRSRSLEISREDLTTIRSHTIAAALRAFEPDLFIVDKLPRGAFGELDAALKSLRARGTRCILGFRDILDDPRTVEREWKESRGEAAVREYFDAVWVYGDPTVYDVLHEYRFSNELAEKMRYTGYLDPSLRFTEEPDDNSAATLSSIEESSRVVFCQMGGGQDGEHLARTFARTDLPPDTIGIILTGPFMAPDARSKLARTAARNPSMRVMEFVPEPAHLLRRADCVIAMGGYNTICEVLTMGKPSLIIPRTHPRSEQLLRAERLRDLGELSLMLPDDMTPASLSQWVERGTAPPCGIRDRIDFNGLARIPHLANELLAAS